MYYTETCIFSINKIIFLTSQYKYFSGLIFIVYLKLYLFSSDVPIVYL